MGQALAADYDVMVMDFRGHGQSGGRFTFGAKEHLDMLAVVDYAKARYARIGVIGFSMGAAAAIIASAQSSAINSLIAVCAPTEFRKIEFNIFKMGFAENVTYNLFQEGRVGKGVRLGNPFLKKIRPFDAINDVRIPVFFIHGQKDWLIYPWHSQALFEKKKGVKKIYSFENGTHAEYLFRSFPQELLRLFISWFQETIPVRM